MLVANRARFVYFARLRRLRARVSARRPADSRYTSNGKRRDALGAEHALVLRDGLPAIMPTAEATPGELRTGIASIEAVCISLVDRRCASRSIALSPEQRGDAVSHLISSAWHEAQRYDPTRVPLNGQHVPAVNGQPRRFSNYIVSRLRWRLTDWLRLAIGSPAGVELVALEAVTSEPAVEYELEARPLWQELGVELDDLSMPARFALVTLAGPISRGESLSAVAAACDVSRHAARDMLEQLERELRDLGLGNG